MNRNSENSENNRDDSQIVDAKSITDDTNNVNAIRNFPEWLDEQLEKLASSYDCFSTSSSRRGYFGRKK